MRYLEQHCVEDNTSNGSNGCQSDKLFLVASSILLPSEGVQRKHGGEDCVSTLMTLRGRKA